MLCSSYNMNFLTEWEGLDKDIFHAMSRFYGLSSARSMQSEKHFPVKPNLSQSISVVVWPFIKPYFKNVFVNVLNWTQRVSC